MTTPCEHKDDIKALHTKLDYTNAKLDKTNDFLNTFALKMVKDVTLLQADSKKAGSRAGGFSGAIVVIVIAIADMISRKMGWQ